MTNLLSRLRAFFLTGLIVLIPVIVSLWALSTIFELLTGGIPRVLGFVLNQDLQQVDARLKVAMQVLGLLLMVLLITTIGMLTRSAVGFRLLKMGERLLLRVPIFSAIYTSVKQIADTFSTNRTHMFRQVVLCPFPCPGSLVMGFVTSDGFDAVRHAFDGEEIVSIFVPTTPIPTAGFLLYMRRKDVQFLNISVSEAMRAIVSGGVVQPSTLPPPAAPVTPPSQPPAARPAPAVPATPTPGASA